MAAVVHPFLASFLPSNLYLNNWWHAIYETGPSKVMVGGGQKCERRALAEIGNLAGAMNTRCNVSKDGFLKPAVPGCSRYCLSSTVKLFEPSSGCMIPCWWYLAFANMALIHYVISPGMLIISLCLAYASYFCYHLALNWICVYKNTHLAIVTMTFSLYISLSTGIQQLSFKTLKEIITPWAGRCERGIHLFLMGLSCFMYRLFHLWARRRIIEVCWHGDCLSVAGSLEQTLAIRHLQPSHPLWYRSPCVIR